MKSYGSTTPGGPLNIPGIPIPADPSLRGAGPQQPPRPAPKPAVARTWGSKVPDHIRAAIVRERIEGDSATLLALRYGISRQRVYAICRGATS